ncbi:MAG TPA: PepSY-like domain-containing protein [Puia sp.]|jgi:hypothetical protein
MKALIIASVLTLVVFGSRAQTLKPSDVPPAVRAGFGKKYPDATRVTWEKEKGNFEANWGGKSGEDNSVQYSPSAKFLEYARAIPAGDLPAAVSSYVKTHYKGQAIREAARVTDAAGRVTYAAEIKGKELIFDDKGSFLKAGSGD